MGQRIGKRSPTLNDVIGNSPRHLQKQNTPLLLCSQHSAKETFTELSASLSLSLSLYTTSPLLSLDYIQTVSSGYWEREREDTNPMEYERIHKVQVNDFIFTRLFFFFIFWCVVFALSFIFWGVGFLLEFCRFFVLHFQPFVWCVSVESLKWLNVIVLVKFWSRVVKSWSEFSKHILYINLLLLLFFFLIFVSC